MRTLPRRMIAERLTTETGESLQLVPWLSALLVAVDDPRYLELLVVLLRQQGKSTGLGAVAMTEVLAVPGSYVLLVSSSLAQQQAVYHRKIRQPFERLLASLGLRSEARFSATGIEVPALGSELRIVAPNEATVSGRTPTKLLIDEAKDIGDQAYAALAPSILASQGKLVAASTTGRPSGWFHALVTNPDPERTWLFRSSEKVNPRASAGALDFLRRRLGLVDPAAEARELEGEFAADGESLFQPELLAAARDERLHELATSPREAYAFLDLSRRRDLTSLVVVLRTDARVAEASDHLVVGSIQTWDPRQSPTGEVPFEEVRAALGQLPARFPALTRLLVDEGAEGGSVLPYCRAHPRLSLVVEGFQASPSSNMQLWSALAARLHGGTLSIPAHERLFRELRALRREQYAFGSRWRVVDGSRSLHRDVSLALAGACYAAGIEDGAWGLVTAFGNGPEPTVNPAPVADLQDDDPPLTERDDLVRRLGATRRAARGRPSSSFVEREVRTSGAWFPGD